ncbi:MAG: methyltransferase domain-containing protein [Chloroflexi bacterium]|nr:methyltransferase domain-containing protein [Chloroflexota bacterium]
MLDNKWNASLYDQKHSFVFEHGKDLLSLLDPQPGERILDVGCGTGHLTQTIAESGARVTGMDNSPAMIESARKAYPALEFVQADVTDFSFTDPFDAIFSNATLHWVARAEKAVVCMAAALRSGGRFVVEFGGKGNAATIVSAAQRSLAELGLPNVDPGWYFPSVGEYASLLERHGLAVERAMLFDRPTPLEDGERGLRNWFDMFGGAFVRAVPDEMKPRFLETVEDHARRTQLRDGHWIVDYRRLRVVARKE